MIPCHICEKDASTGWNIGFIPAPDSQKLALCPEHDTHHNRLIVSKAWHALHEREISIMTSVAKHKASPGLQVVSIHFTGGGMISFVCTACFPTDHGTLRIDDPDGKQTYIPILHIREYAVRPYAHSTEKKSPPGA
jgi:hypothetical protein